MKTTDKNKGLVEIICEDPEKTLRRKGASQTSRLGRVIVKADEADDWEEAEISPFTKDEYDAKVNELIRERYSQSEELAIQRKTLSAAFSPQTLSEEQGVGVMREFAAYNAYAEKCKLRAKDAKLYKEKDLW